MKSVMKNANPLVNVNVPRSVFDRSHGHKTTFDVDYLIPIFIDEALPGDSKFLNMEAFIRLNTPLFPFMDNLSFESFFFSVPNRLIWENWQRFCGEQTDPGDSIDYTIPAVSSSTTADLTGTAPYQLMANYMGLPYKSSVDLSEISALPFRAYNLIWNEWFRDENLQNSVNKSIDDGPDAFSTDYALLKRGKAFDYFTSCLPWPQKGDSIELPLGTSAEVHVPGGAGTYVSVYNDNGSDWRAINTGGADGLVSTTVTSSATGMYADLSTATAATINQIREAFQVQKLIERDARGGTRYTEILRSHFGVTSPDSRVQRPEFLGGGKQYINITPVAQTSNDGTTANGQPGTLGAMGTLHVQNHGFKKSFTEHCTIIGLINVRADLTYQQGLDRMWSRATRYDYYWPSLAHIGEQAVLNQEIYYQNTPADDGVFGYQGRYDEYRFKKSLITGKLQSANAASLDAWHLAQDFSSLPTLGSTFIECNTPIDRVVAVTTEPDFVGDFFFHFKDVRPLPTYSIPGWLDHF